MKYLFWVFILLIAQVKSGFALTNGVYIKPVLSSCAKCSMLLPHLQKEHSNKILYVIPESNNSFWREHLDKLLDGNARVVSSDSLYQAIAVNHSYSASLIIEDSIYNTISFTNYSDLKDVIRLVNRISLQSELVNGRSRVKHSINFSLLDSLRVCEFVSFSPSVDVKTNGQTTVMLDQFSKQLHFMSNDNMLDCNSYSILDLNIDSLYNSLWPTSYLEYKYGDSIYKSSGFPNYSSFSSVGIQNNAVYVLTTIQDYTFSKKENKLKIGRKLLLLNFFEGDLVAVSPVIEQFKNSIALSDAEGVFVSSTGRELYIKNAWTTKDSIVRERVLSKFIRNKKGLYEAAGYVSGVKLPMVFLENWKQDFRNYSSKFNNSLLYYYGSNQVTDLKNGQIISLELDSLDPFDSEWIIKNGKNKVYVGSVAYFNKNEELISFTVVDNIKQKVTYYLQDVLNGKIVARKDLNFDDIEKKIIHLFEDKIYILDSSAGALEIFQVVMTG